MNEQMISLLAAISALLLSPARSQENLNEIVLSLAEYIAPDLTEMEIFEVIRKCTETTCDVPLPDV